MLYTWCDYEVPGIILLRELIVAPVWWPGVRIAPT
jgi:hypothetical protein